MELDDRTVVELWQAGLGEAYRESRGSNLSPGLFEKPEHRITYYIVGGTTLSLMGLVCLATFAFTRDIPLLSGLCAVVGILALLGAIPFLSARSKLEIALANHADTDLQDPVRMKTLRRAVKWGFKKGLLKPGEDGSIKFCGE